MGDFVYSTQYGRMCAHCDKPIVSCICPRGTRGGGTVGDGVVRVGRETKGRKGKGVTIVTGVPGAGDELAAVCKELKKRCGSGGTVKDGTIEIQGDHRALVVELLEKKGWTVKRSGG
jgi:translation initiation factor 1